MSSDQVLEYLVQKTEETSIGINITLTINGLVIVGELISSKNYYDYMSGLFEAFTEKSKEKIVENTATPDSSEPVKIETQNIYREDFKEFMIKMRSKKNQENGEPKYIHLRNAEVWEIFSTEPFRFEYWRGKLLSFVINIRYSLDVCKVISLYLHVRDSKKVIGVSQCYYSTK